MSAEGRRETCCGQVRCPATADLTLEHEAVLEAVQGLDRSPDRCVSAARRSNIPSANLGWERRTSQMKTLKNVSTEMALHLTYNMKRTMSILRVGDLMEALRI